MASGPIATRRIGYQRNAPPNKVSLAMPSSTKPTQPAANSAAGAGLSCAAAIGAASSTSAKAAEMVLIVMGFAADNVAREHITPFAGVERLHDDRMVRTPEIRARLAALEGDRDLVGHRLRRVLPGRAGEPVRVRAVHRLRAEDHPGSRDAGGVQRIRDRVPEGTFCMELCGRLRVPWRGGLFRVWIQNHSGKL